MKKIALTTVTLILLGCNSTGNDNSVEHSQLTVIQGAISTNKWRELERFPPRYPLKEASKGTEGCATIEYVINANNELSEIKVIDYSSRNFAKEAKNVVKNWRWSTLPKGIITSAIKTQTRFEFCLEGNNQHCAIDRLAAKKQCSGKDVVASIGYKIK